MTVFARCVGPFCKWASEPPSSEYEPVDLGEVLAGDPAPAVAWLAGHRAGSVRHRDLQAEGILGGLLRLRRGSVTVHFREAEDAYVVDGRAIFRAGDGRPSEVTAGDCFIAERGCQGVWDIQDGLRLFSVRGGGIDRPAGDWTYRVIRPGAETAAYRIANVAGGSDVSSEVQWLRTGPEGTGAFFSGWWSAPDTIYFKRFVADEFVLVLTGSITVSTPDATLRVGAGEIGLFQRGTSCYRKLTGGFSQYFAGR